MYRTTPIAVGLGADAPRPSWCPGTSLAPGQRDPCEVVYSFDLPLVGKTSFGLPVPAMTNDALLTVQSQLPQILDQSLPVIFAKVKPYIDSVVADMEYEVPALADKIMKQQVLPELNKQKEDLIAQSDVMLQKTILGLAVVTLIGIGGYYFVKKRL